LRRRTAVGRPTPAGSSRVERLDPFSLPVRFEVGDQPVDDRARCVVLTSERVVLCRAVRGMAMAIELPVTAYLGVALRMEPPENGSAGAVSVVLEHRDPALSLPLYRATDGSDVVAEWQSWARVLRMPLLVAETDGRLREPFPRIGAVRIASPIRRRRRRLAIKARRPSILLRRKPGRWTASPRVHRGEHEIIARN
jgi:hypothetical protein